MPKREKKPSKKITYKKGPGDKIIRPRDEYGARTVKKKTSIAKEPIASYTTRIRAIGNSKGVILNNHLIEAAGLSPDADVVIQAGDGVILIIQSKDSGVNTDLSTWDRQFKAVIKKGAKPEGDMFKGIANEFDEKEW